MDEQVLRDRVVDPYYRLVIDLYRRLAYELVDVPTMSVRFDVTGGLIIDYRIRKEEPAYMVARALISVLRIDPEERRKLLRALDHANAVYTLRIDDDTVAICGGFDRERCIEEAKEDLCSEEKDDGCLKIVYSINGLPFTISMIVSVLKLKRLAKLVPIIGSYVLNTLQREVMLYRE